MSIYFSDSIKSQQTPYILVRLVPRKSILKIWISSSLPLSVPLPVLVKAHPLIETDSGGI